MSRQAPQCKSSADADKLIAKIDKYKTEGAAVQDDRLNKMERIATELYGECFCLTDRPMAILVVDPMASSVTGLKLS